MASGGEQAPIALLVQGIPPDVDEVDVENFFAHKNNGGCGDVEEVTFLLGDRRSKTARITFDKVSAPSTIEAICSKRRILNGKELQLKKEMPQMSPTAPKQGQTALALLVHNIPNNVDELDLETFFGHKNNGGCGDVDEVMFPLDGNHPASARITFTSDTGSATIQRIMAGKRVMKGRTLRLEKEEPKASQDNRPVLVVHNLPADVPLKLIEAFFGSKKNGGDGDVVEIMFPLDGAHPLSAKVVFEKRETVERIRGAERSMKGNVLQFDVPTDESSETDDVFLEVSCVVNPEHAHEVDVKLGDTDFQSIVAKPSGGKTKLTGDWDTLAKLRSHFMGVEEGDFHFVRRDECGPSDDEAGSNLRNETSPRAIVRQPQAAKINRPVDTLQDLDPAVVFYLKLISGEGYGVMKKSKDYGLIKAEHQPGDEFCQVLFFKGAPKNVKGEFQRSYDNAERMSQGERMNVPGICRGLVDRVIEETNHRRPDCASVRVGEEIRLRGTQGAIDRELQQLEGAVMSGQCDADCPVCGDGRGGTAGAGKNSNQPRSRLQSDPAAQQTPARPHKDKTRPRSPAKQPQPPVSDGPKDTLCDLDPAIVFYLELMFGKGYGVIKDANDYDLIRVKHNPGDESCKVLFFAGAPRNAKKEFKKSYDNAERMSIGERMSVPSVCPGLVDKAIKETNHRRPDCAAVRVGEEIKLRGTQGAIDRELQKLEFEVIDGHCDANCPVCGTGGAAAGSSDQSDDDNASGGASDGAHRRRQDQEGRKFDTPAAATKRGRSPTNYMKGQMGYGLQVSGNTKVYCYKGDITKMSVDAIVNTTDEDFSMSNGVSGALRKAAGYELEKECKDYRSSHGKLSRGEAVMTRAYKLQANCVVHTVGPSYGSHQAKEGIMKAVTACLAEGDVEKITSIAIPAIGAGGCGISMEDSTNAICKAVLTYCVNQPTSSALTAIHLVDINDRTAQKLSYYMNHWMQGKASLKDAGYKGYVPATTGGGSGLSELCSVCNRQKANQRLSCGQPVCRDCTKKYCKTCRRCHHTSY